MDGGLPSMDSRVFPWMVGVSIVSTIHLIAAIYPPIGLPSIDGICHL